MSRDVPGHVWPSLKFWYCLAFILSPSWVISFLAMDFVKKTTPLLLLLLILTIFLLSVANICVLLKFYFFPQTNRFFRSYTGAKKIAGYAVFLVTGVGLNYVPEKSVASMLTLISLSLYCLCTLLCIQPHTDFGAFEFLLGGSVTQAFKCFGAHSPYSWLVLFACIVIFSIRYCLKPTIMKDVAIKIREFKPHFKQLQLPLNQITPIFDDTDRLNRMRDSRPDGNKLFASKLVEGNKLLLKCARTKSWNLYHKHSYAMKLIEFDESPQDLDSQDPKKREIWMV